jgi:hypothetical protein
LSARELPGRQPSSGTAPVVSLTSAWTAAVNYSSVMSRGAQAARMTIMTSVLSSRR